MVVRLWKVVEGTLIPPSLKPWRTAASPGCMRAQLAPGYGRVPPGFQARFPGRHLARLNLNGNRRCTAQKILEMPQRYAGLGCHRFRSLETDVRRQDGVGGRQNRMISRQRWLQIEYIEPRAS